MARASSRIGLRGLTRTLASINPASVRASSSSSHYGPQNERTGPKFNLLTLAGISVLSFGAGVLFIRHGGGNHATALSSSHSQYGGPDDIRAALNALQHAFADRPGVVSTDESDGDTHARWFTGRKTVIPHNVVVYPETTQDVVKVVELAKKYRIPVVPYSGGTSLEGHIAGTEHGSICVDLSRMDRILEIHEADADVVVQPGVGWMVLNEELRDRGIPLFFPLDPAPSATLGGMFSTGCSGTNAVRYGTARGEWFLNATIVLPSGEVIKTRRRFRKSSAGWDVTKLFIGAEGTLGIVTELTIRLAPVLPTAVAIVSFPNVRKASDAVVELLNRGAGLQCIELLDKHQMRAFNAHLDSPRKYAEVDHLFLKLQGATINAMTESEALAREITSKHGGENWMFAEGEEAHSMWNDRKNAAFASVLYGGPGSKTIPTDVCVPVSKLPQLVEDFRKDINEAGIIGTIVGHAGDGNFHATLSYSDAEQEKAAHAIMRKMVKRALDLDGTCTGEHGVGISKREYLNDELGPGTVRLMKTIKRAVDPLGLFNPGKLYPDD
ncbi:unnamed protein product [Peniophora sp. CBMAI 1063]|nr:unnamed protein product [Peniophora sp. CBMAI 1063]